MAAVKLVDEKKELLAKGKEALSMAQKLEAKRIAAGWRYMSYGNNKELLVPCKKDGKPTKKGLAMLERYKNL